MDRLGLEALARPLALDPQQPATTRYGNRVFRQGPSRARSLQLVQTPLRRRLDRLLDQPGQTALCRLDPRQSLIDEADGQVEVEDAEQPAENAESVRAGLVGRLQVSADGEEISCKVTVHVVSSVLATAGQSARPDTPGP